MHSVAHRYAITEGSLNHAATFGLTGDNVFLNDLCWIAGVCQQQSLRGKLCFTLRSSSDHPKGVQRRDCHVYTRLHFYRHSHSVYVCLASETGFVMWSK